MPTKLTTTLVAQIRLKHAAGRSQNTLAREFGVTQATIYQVVHGDTWGWMPGAKRNPMDDYWYELKQIRIQKREEERWIRLGRQLIKTCRRLINQKA